MPHNAWPDMLGRKLMTEKSKNILAVSLVTCNSGVNCDIKFTIYQCRKIAMTTHASYMRRDCCNTIEYKKLEKYFGCDVFKMYFRR